MHKACQSVSAAERSSRVRSSAGRSGREGLNGACFLQSVPQASSAGSFCGGGDREKWERTSATRCASGHTVSLLPVLRAGLLEERHRRAPAAHVARHAVIIASSCCLTPPISSTCRWLCTLSWQRAHQYAQWYDGMLTEASRQEAALIFSREWTTLAVMYRSLEERGRRRSGIALLFLDSHLSIE